MAVQDYELLLRVRADLMEAMAGLKGLTDELGKSEQATQTLGETAEETDARIKGVVDRAVEYQRAQRQSAAATREAAAAAKATVGAYDVQADAQRRAALEANRLAAAQYRNDINVRKAANEYAAGMAIKREEMARLAGQIDPTINALKRLND